MTVTHAMKIESETNAIVLSHDAKENTEFCQVFSDSTGDCECGKSRCSQFGCYSRSRVCQTRSKNSVSFGMFTKDTTTCTPALPLLDPRTNQI
jgi:hypothetical protein